MLWGTPEPEGLELRRDSSGGVAITGRFPYNKMAVLSDGGKSGRPRKEKFSPGAFAHSVENAQQEIYLLSGHEFAKPLASKGSGTYRSSEEGRRKRRNGINSWVVNSWVVKHHRNG